MIARTAGQVFLLEYIPGATAWLAAEDPTGNDDLQIVSEVGKKELDQRQC